MPLAVETSQLLSVLLVLIGMWGAASPARVTSFATRFTSKNGMWFASGIRLVFGLALWFAAPESRNQPLLQIMGALAILAAAIIPMMGVERFKGMLDWWKALSTTSMRLWCLLAVGFGVIVLWALVPTAS